MAKSKFSADIHQRDLSGFIDHAAAAALIDSPRRSKLLIWVVFVFVVCAIVWASWAQLDEVTVGEGRVIPSQQIQVVQNLEGGIVKEIFVAEGDRVGIGEALLRIDDTRFNSDFRERQQQLDFLQALVARLNSELSSIRIINDGNTRRDWRNKVQVKPQVIPSLVTPASSMQRSKALKDIIAKEQTQLGERLRNLSNQLVILERQIEQREQEKLELKSTVKHLGKNYRLALEELRLTQPLAYQGVVPRVELIKLEREVNGIKQELDASTIQLPRLDSAIREVILKRRDAALQYRRDTREQLASAESELAQLKEAQVGLRDRVARTLVVSPVNGIVKSIGINTVGGVVQPGMDLVEIVPAEDNLLVEANILPKDIGFLRPGLNAMVRFTAYDSSIYGGLTGQVEHISADSIEDEQGDIFFLIRVRTERNFLGDEKQLLPIIPGMVASVDVITGKKTVLDYLLKPILKAQQSALRER